MYQQHDYQLLRHVRDERHAELRRAASVARVQRLARAERRRQRAERRATRRAERAPHLVAPPPALAD